MALVDYIRDYFGDRIEICYTGNRSSYDLLLVVNACQVACASLDGLQQPRKAMYVVRTAAEAEPDPSNPVVRWIQQYLQEQ